MHILRAGGMCYGCFIVKSLNKISFKKCGYITHIIFQKAGVKAVKISKELVFKYSLDFMMHFSKRWPVITKLVI